MTTLMRCASGEPAASERPSVREAYSAATGGLANCRAPQKKQDPLSKTLDAVTLITAGLECGAATNSRGANQAAVANSQPLKADALFLVELDQLAGSAPRRQQALLFSSR